MTYLLVAGTVTWGDDRPTRKLLVAGWDSPRTDQLCRDQAEIQNRPFDATAAWGRNSPGHSKWNTTLCRAAFSNEPWKLEWFHEAIEDLLQSQQKLQPPLEVFLKFDASPGNVDWFDDEGWSHIVEHFRIIARVAREGGAAGLLFDAEPYHPPFAPFDYRRQPNLATKSLEEYQQKARQRGRETMRAIGGEFPHITIFSLFLFSYLVDSSPYNGPSPFDVKDPQTALAQHAYGLLPAFLEGWLDAIPATAQLIDGNEQAYFYTEADRFGLATQRMKQRGPILVSEAHREKFQDQIQMAHGLYLDAHVPALKNPYQLPQAGPVSLKKNLTAAFDTTDQYVWLWGEYGQFWPPGGSCAEWIGKQDHPPWSHYMPEMIPLIHEVRSNTVPRKSKFISKDQVAPQSNNRQLTAVELVLPDDVQWMQSTDPWQSKQDADSQGTCRFLSDGEIWQIENMRFGGLHHELPVKPGERLGLRAEIQVLGQGWPRLEIGWKRADGTPLPSRFRRMQCDPTDAPLSKGWSRWEVSATAPPEAATAVLRVVVSAQRNLPDRVHVKNLRLARAIGQSLR